MNLSKSKYCKAVQCLKMLWMSEFMPDEGCDVSNGSVLDNGTFVGVVAKDLFGFHVDIKFNDDLNIMISDTKSLLNMDKIVITEASFLYENNFCSVDILRKIGNDFEIYEVKSSTNLKDIFISDISYQAYVLSKLGYNVTKASVVYINSKYERKGDLDLFKLFNIVDVTERLDSLDYVQNKINEISDYMSDADEPDCNLGMHCVKPYDCPFFKFCTRNLPDNNVFNIRIMHSDKKFDLYDKGIFRYEDLLNSDINDKYKQQIEFELYDKKPYINKDKIKSFLDTLSFPLYFLDFESFQQPIPIFDNVKPYDQIPFQYSLHYTDDDEIKHTEFLAEPDIDPRRSLALSLINDIPDNVCVLAYNMSFEKRIIKSLANLYPDLSRHLMSIHDNIKDLMVPFYNRDYYTKDMHGSYSIKYVLPALFPFDPSLNYHNLEDVHNGAEAMNAYSKLGLLSSIERERLRNNMLKYCCLDTYAMVKIWQKLVEVSKK